MTTRHPKIYNLLLWCSDSGVLLDPRLRIETDSDGRNMRVCSDAVSIPAQTIVVQIPRDSVLSAKSCSFSEFVTLIPHGIGAQFTLALALYGEILRGRLSRWSAYIQSLPQDLVDLPIFWNVETSDTNGIDGAEGLRWLCGTEVERRVGRLSDSQGGILEDMQDYFQTVVIPLIMDHSDFFPHSSPSLQGFYRAYGLVSSRAFLVDAYHGLAMVPIADAFNHVVENHVHLESEYAVCPRCGSLDECTHDRDEASIETGFNFDMATRTSHQIENGIVSEAETSYDMVSTCLIPPRTEIFNTYGETLSNAELLVQYGFILDDTDNDRLTWGVEEFRDFLKLGDATWRQVLVKWQGHLQTESSQHRFVWKESQMVYFNQTRGEDLCLNPDGRISHQLWLLVTLCAIAHVQEPLWEDQSELPDRISDIAELHLSLERVTRHMQDNDDLDNSPGWNPASPEKTSPLAPQYLGIICAVGKTLVEWCRLKKASSGKTQSPDLDLGDILDGLHSGMRRTRMAITILINERSLLDSCQHSWGDFIETIDPSAG
ncbi:SET domain-containing protein [Pluteus cervinus]|uniref:SET domain-containing protein n=1 Tax=Pluteus cervinus TaxID=181527 RepID=A0ACD3AIW0_9AGAR|nr:SET domain-containing protein [Pluteus cervinus]